MWRDTGLRRHDGPGLTAIRFGDDAEPRWQTEALDVPRLLFVTRGRVELLVRGVGRCSIRRGRMALIPAGHPARLRIHGITRVVLCNIDTAMACRDGSTGERLSPSFVSADRHITVHTCTKTVEDVLSLTEMYLRLHIRQNFTEKLLMVKQHIMLTLYRQFGIDSHLVPMPWHEQFDKLMNSRPEKPVITQEAMEMAEQMIEEVLKPKYMEA